MKYQISLDDSLNSCPVCEDKDNQIKENELKNIHQIIDNIYIEIENPKKHYLQTCGVCNTSYKSDFPSIKTESFLTNIWNSNTSSRYQDKPSWKLQKIAKHILGLAKSKTIKVLDIGIGEGSYLEILAHRENIEIYLMDCDKEVLDRIGNKINAKKIFADIGNKDNIKELNNKFDVITAFDLIEHIPSSLFIENINYLLKPGGTFIAETGNKENVFCKIFGIENWWYTNILEHKVLWNKKALKDKLIDSGFTKINISKAIHKDRRLINLIKDFVKSIIWLIKIIFLRKKISSLRNPKFPIKDQLFIFAKK
tara:strand:- start:31466 stop:32395 length:930 start_codon:yes stop_codon:yes gene_type:complete